jgi:hypothetical protein
MGFFWQNDGLQHQWNRRLGAVLVPSAVATMAVIDSRYSNQSDDFIRRGSGFFFLRDRWHKERGEQ